MVINMEKSIAVFIDILIISSMTKRIIVKSRYGTLGFSVPADISKEELQSKRDSALEFLEGLYDRTSR